MHKTPQLTTTVLSLASISQLDAAHKRKPQDTNNERKSIILILFIIPFLNYYGLPVVSRVQIFTTSKNFYFDLTEIIDLVFCFFCEEETWIATPN